MAVIVQETMFAAAAAKCDVCGAEDMFTVIGASLAARAAVASSGWLVIRPDRPVQDTKGNPITAVCPRCRPVIEKDFPATTGDYPRPGRPLRNFG